MFIFYIKCICFCKCTVDTQYVKNLMFPLFFLYFLSLFLSLHLLRLYYFFLLLSNSLLNSSFPEFVLLFHQWRTLFMDVHFSDNWWCWMGRCEVLPVIPTVANTHKTHSSTSLHSWFQQFVNTTDIHTYLFMEHRMKSSLLLQCLTAF